MMGAIEAPRGTGHRLQQVGAPDRLADLERPGREHVALQLALLEQPDLEADAALGALLAGRRVRDDHVHVAEQHPNPLEPECIEHAASRSRDLPDHRHSRRGRAPGL
jgi:hypothetical protein